jgi:outer membrane receptor protein involved in Fe transport
MVTNEVGVYRFPSLPVGTYEVIIAMQGFTPVTVRDVSVSLGGTASVDVTLQLAVTTETVSVVGESPVVDVTSSGVSSSLKDELLEEIPTQRNMSDLIQVQPGMSVDVGDGQSDRVVAFGSNRQSNSWNVDGVEVSAPETGAAWWTVNPDVIEEIQVIGVGAPAEYGNHTGGVFNVVTKSGSNEFHGNASYFFQTDGLTDTNVRLPDSEFTFTRDHFRNFSGQFGGPIVRDNTWFFASTEYLRDSSTEPGNDPAFAPTVYSDSVDVKVTTRLGRYEYSGFGHWERWGSPEIPAPNYTQSALSGERGTNPAWGAGVQTALNDRLLLEFRYAGWWSDDIHDSQTGSFEEPFFDYTPDNGGPTTYSGGVYFPWDYVTWRQQVKAKATYYAQSFLKTQHEFKMGLQYSKGSALTNVGIGPNGSYTYAYGDYLYRAVQDPYQYGGVSQDIGLFVDDTVTVNDRLTLNLGVRYDYNTGSIPDYDRLAIGTPSLSPSGNYVSTGETIPGFENLISWNLISPRLGFAFKPRSDGRAVIRGSFGVYYDHNVIGNWDAPAPGLPTFRLFQQDPTTGQFDILIDEVTSEDLSFNPDMDPPRTLQYSIGYEQQVFGNMSIGAQYIYKTTKDLVGWEILGGTYENVPFTDPFTGREFNIQSQVELPVLRKGNDPGTFPGSENLDYFQRYHGLMISVGRKYAENWAVNGSYTWSRSEGLIPRMLAQEQFNPFYSSREGSDPNNFINAEGSLQGDRPHMFRLQGLVMLPYEVQLSTSTEFSSGRAHTRQIRVGDLGQGTVSVIMERGFRYSPIQNIDLLIGKRIPLNDRVTLRFEGWVFNLLNDDQELHFADLRLQQATDTFTADQWVKPRRLQFRFGVQF